MRIEGEVLEVRPRTTPRNQSLDVRVSLTGALRRSGDFEAGRYALSDTGVLGGSMTTGGTVRRSR